MRIDQLTPRKRYLAIALGLLACAAPAYAADNLLANPGFESATLSGPFPGPNGNWEPSDPTVTRQTAVVHSGSAALAISGPSSSEWHTSDQDLAWNAGDPAYVSVWVKTNFVPTDGQRAGVLVQFVGDAVNDGPVLGELKRDVGGANDWRLLEVTGTAPAGTKQLRVRLFLWSSVTPLPNVQAHFDDAVLEKTLKPLQPQTALLNPNFDNGLNDWLTISVPALAVTGPVVNPPYAAQATVNSVDTQEFWSQTYQDVSYGAGQPLHAAVRVRPNLSATSSARAGLLVEFFDAASTKLGELKRETGGIANDWQLVELFATTPLTTASMRYTLYVWAGQGDAGALSGTATFDACVLDAANPPPPPPAGTNVLSNPGFESGLVDWSPSGYPASTVSSPVFEGGFSAELRVSTVATQNFWSALSQEAPFAAQQPVYASARMQTSLAALSAGKAGILLQFLDSTGNVVGELKREIGGTQSWRLLELATTAPAGTAKVRYHVYLYAPQNDAASVNGAANIDACVLKQSSQQPIPQTQLLNAGFENGINDWSTIRQATPPFIGSTAAARNGTYGAEDTIENRAGGYFSSLFQELVVPDAYGKGYDASVWVKPQAIQGGVAGLLMQFFDTAGQPVGTENRQQLSGTSDWAPLAVRGAFPAGTAKIRFSVFVFGDANGEGGKGLFDDAAITIAVLPANQPPSVNAGADQTITLPSSATLNGSATDDGQPNPPGAITYQWSQVSGPGTVTFASATSATTIASVSAAGTYVLRLTASDSQLTGSDDIQVTVNPVPPGNQPPVANAGADQTITLPSAATLNGAATDDGLPNPPAALTYQWTKVSGPGTVTFATATSAQTTASFSPDGTYVLRLTASDSQLTGTDDVTITVNPVPPDRTPPTVAWTSPVNGQIVSGQIIASATATDNVGVTRLDFLDGAGTVTMSFTQPPYQFPLDTTRFPNGSYTATVKAYDAAGNVGQQTISFTVSNAPTNQAPSVNAGADQTITLPSAATLNGAATDDGLPNPPAALTYQWTKVSGPGTVTFATATSAQTAASFSPDGTYVLRLTASDSVLNAADDITIMVQPQPPAGEAGAYQHLVERMDAFFTGDQQPRLIESYATPYPPGPDVTLERIAFTYDNALAVMAFVSRGTANDLQRARLICDAFLWHQQHDPLNDGRLRQAYHADDNVTTAAAREHLVTGFAHSYTGDLAWAGLALTTYFEAVRDPNITNPRNDPNARYLDAAIAIRDFLTTRVRDTAAPGWYLGFAESLTDRTTAVPVAQYAAITTTAQDVTIPLAAFAAQGLNLQRLRSISLLFDAPQSSTGAITVDAVRLVNQTTGASVVVDNFADTDRAHNALGFSVGGTVNATADPMGRILAWNSPSGSPQFWFSQLTADPDNALPRFDAADYTHLVLRIAGSAGGERFTVELKGYPVNQTLQRAKSTEHNLAAYVLFKRLEVLVGDTGCPGGCAGEARRFVQEKAWDAADGKFWAGTVNETGTLNLVNLTVDQQALVLLALGGVNGYGRALDWADRTLKTTSDGFTGFDYGINVNSTDPWYSPLVDGVWFEGTAQMACAYEVSRVYGGSDQSSVYLGELRRAQQTATNANGKSLVAASRDRVTTGYPNFSYFASSHIGATAWYIAANRHLNMFWNTSTNVPVPHDTVNQNQPPSVNAGADQTITLPSTATLNGSATDDGLPNPPGILTYQWTTVSGPGTVTFASATSATTIASVSAAGTYVLRLTASDSQLTGSDDIQVTVNPAPDRTPPTVAWTSPVNGQIVSGQIIASATATDNVGVTRLDFLDGAGTVTMSFTQPPYQFPLDTTRFPNGSYTATVKAYDAAGNVGQQTISFTVSNAPTNQAPSVNAGADQTITLPSAATLNGAATDDGLPNPPGTLTYQWTTVSGPGTVTFATATSAQTTASMSAAGTYVLRLTASDSQLTGSDDIQVTVNPPGSNQLANPGFESAILNGPFPGPQSNWEPSDPTVTRQNDVVRSGAWALRISGPSASQFHAGDQDLAWNGGDPVHASVWVKTNFSPVSKVRAGLLVQFIGDPQQDVPVLLERKQEVGGINDWRFLEVSEVAPVGTRQVRVRLFFFSGDLPAPNVQAYFDDAALEKAYQPPPLPAQLINPHFDNGLNDWAVIGIPATAVTSPVYDDPYAARVIIDDVSTIDFWSQTLQQISYGAGQPLHAAAQIKTDLNGLSTARAGVQVEFYDAANTKLGETKREVAGAHDWRLAELFTTTPAGTASVRYSLYVFAGLGDTRALGGSVMFDTAVIDQQSPPPRPPDGANLLGNPGFEDGLVDWTMKGIPPYTVGNPHYEGLLAAAFTVNDVSAQDFWSELFQTVPIGANLPVYASARIQPALHPTAQAKVGVLLEFLDAAGNVLAQRKREIGGTQGWRSVEVADRSPAGTVAVTYHVYLFAPRGDTLATNGSVYADACELKISNQQPPPQTELLNPGYENGSNDWTLIRQSSPPMVASAASARTGSYGVEDTIENRVGALGYFCSLSQELIIPPPAVGQGMTASAWVKPQAIQGGSAGVQVRFLDASGLSVGASIKKEVSGTADWAQQVVNTAVPQGAVTVRYSVFTFGDPSGLGGKAFFDDAALAFNVPLFNNAQFINQSAPSTTVGGHTYPVSVMMKNTGTKSWISTADSPSGYRLGAQHQEGRATWNAGYVDLAAGETIVPGQTKTFAFNVTAPTAPGTYHMQWRMEQVGVAPFGDPTLELTITVQSSGDTTRPTVAWTSPVNGQIVSGQIIASATASDNVGVTRVDFLDGSGNLIRSFTAAPYSYPVDTTQMADGTYPGTVNAYDAAGNVGSQTIHFTVANYLTREAQFISQSVPMTMVAGQRYPVSVTMRNSGTITWDGLAGYALGNQYPQDTNASVWGVSRVPLMQGDMVYVIRPGQTHTFSFTVTAPTTPGTYHFQWQMLQEGVTWFGQPSADLMITVPSSTDTTRPTVAWTSPVNGATVSGAITVAATASDNVGVTRLDFLDGAGNVTMSFTHPPYQFPLETTPFPDGTYQATVNAYDAAGNVGSQTIHFTVANAPYQHPSGCFIAHDSAPTTNTQLTVRLPDYFYFSAYGPPGQPIYLRARNLSTGQTLYDGQWGGATYPFLPHRFDVAPGSHDAFIGQVYYEVFAGNTLLGACTVFVQPDSSNQRR